MTQTLTGQTGRHTERQTCTQTDRQTETSVVFVICAAAAAALALAGTGTGTGTGHHTAPCDGVRVGANRRIAASSLFYSAVYTDCILTPARHCSVDSTPGINIISNFFFTVFEHSLAEDSACSDRQIRSLIKIMSNDQVS